MDTSAYDKHLPCLNPQCKSHGRPHPRCKCYSLAHGGEVGSCIGAHNEGCEYYLADGGQVPMFDDLPVSHGPESIPPFDSLGGNQPTQSESVPSFDDLPVSSPETVNEEKATGEYETTEQKVKTGVEGALQGLAGPLVPYIETKYLGVKPEDIKGRAEANPLIHGGAEAATFVGSMLTGVGEAGLITKTAGALAEGMELGKIGSAVLKGAIESASFTGADEVTKSILQQPGSDPSVPASAALLHVGAAGLMGGLGGGVFGLGEAMIGRGFDALKDKKVINTAQNLLSKLGSEGKPLDKLGVTKALKTQIDVLAYPVAGAISAKTGIPAGIALGAIERMVEKPFQFAVGKLNNYATDGIIHCLLTNSEHSIPNAIHYANNILRGVQKVNSAMGSLFSAGVSKIAPDVSDKSREFVKRFIEGGQVDQQMQNSLQSQGEAFADGGVVSSQTNHFAKTFPTQNILLNAAKGRVSQYLNSIRPISGQPKAPFDDDRPDQEKVRQYNKAIDFAVSPLSILDRVNKGNLTPSDMKHFTGLYPEIHQYLSKEMTKNVLKTQLKKEKPPYSKRQAMSLFLGVDLDSSFSQSSIAAIQSGYAAKSQSQRPQAQKPKKSTAPLSKLAPSSLTGEQARAQRQQNQKA